MQTRIVLVRHAAVDNGSRLCGSLDVPLSAAGRDQVRALLRGRIRLPAPDALFTSSLTRARDVARQLGRAWGMKPKAASWAREIHCGTFEGMPLEQIQREFSPLWARNEAQIDETFAWPGGETYTDFRARVLSGLDGAVAAFSGGRIVVVTHAGVISQVLGTLKGRPACVWNADRPNPLTATEVAWQDGAPRTLIAFNDPDWY